MNQLIHDFHKLVGSSVNEEPHVVPFDLYRRTAGLAALLCTLQSLAMQGMAAAQIWNLLRLVQKAGRVGNPVIQTGSQ